MAKTGYKIIETIIQSFGNGFPSGSVATGSTNSTITLTSESISSSLDEETYFYRSFSPIDCIEGLNSCQSPILTSVFTGSQRGYFDLNYVTESILHSYNNITASISNKEDFSNEEIFSASIGTTVPISSSFVSGTVYFKAFTSCSGISPDRSPDADLVTFTFEENPPVDIKGEVQIQFVNNLSSPMKVEIRSRRGSNNYLVDSLDSFNYDYSNSPITGAWSSTGISPDLDITIKGGAKSEFGNFIQRTTEGSERLTYTTGSGFENPSSNTDNSNTFPADEGINFTVRQLSLPPTGETTTTTFSLIQGSPVQTGSSDPTDHTITPTIRFGSAPLESQDTACADSKINFKEETYFQLGGYLYNSREDAESRIRPSLPFNTNFILTGVSTYLIVNQEGYIQEEKSCVLPSLEVFTQDGAFATQEAACRRNKDVAGSTVFSYKDNKLTGDGRNLSGRFPLNNNAQGGRNVILSAGNIVGFETCGTELETIQLSIYGYPSSSYPFDTPELINPETLAVACGDDTFTTYYQDDDGVIFYDFDGSLAYDTVGDGGYYYKNESDEFLLLADGLILSSSSPC
jgi:hypothetical protein